MKAPLWRFASTVLIVILGIGSPGQGQLSAGPAEDAQPASEVLLEARVLSVPKGALGALGLLPETGEPTSLKNFLIPLAESETRSLAGDPRAKTVHSLTLHATAGNRTQFRIDTRVPGSSSAPIDTYFLIGIGIEATPTIRSNRVVSLLTGSVVQIRRGPGPNRGVAPLLYETPLTRHEVQVPDGMTILLGGFAGGANVPPVPEMAEVPGNPVYNYIMSKAPRSEDDPEIVVMLTPHLPGAPAAAPKVPAITAVPVPAPSIPEPVAVTRAVPPAVIPNRLIPESVLTTPPATPQVSMPVSVLPAEQARIDLPAPAPAPPLPARPAPPTRPSPPAAELKQLIPAAVASAPRSTPEVPLPISVKLAPATKLYLPVPTSPLPGPQQKTELPTLISSAWTPAPRTNSAYVIATEPAVTALDAGSATTSRTMAPSASPTDGRPVNAFHSVQVGAFRDRSRAEALAAEMKKKFGGAFIESDPSARTPYRVRVGRLHDLASARKLQRRLRALGYDSFVVFPASI